MIKNELIYFNSNILQISAAGEEDTRKNRTSFNSKHSSISIENYEQLKREEMSAEIGMHQNYILQDIVPLMNSDTAMFTRQPDLLQGLINYGANCILSYHASRHEMGIIISRDPVKLSAQLNNEIYQQLIKELRLSCHDLI